MARKSIIIDTIDGYELKFTKDRTGLFVEIEMVEIDTGESVSKASLDKKGFSELKSLFDYGDNKIEIERQAELEDFNSDEIDESKLEMDLRGLNDMTAKALAEKLYENEDEDVSDDED